MRLGRWQGVARWLRKAIFPRGTDEGSEALSIPAHDVPGMWGHSPGAQAMTGCGGTCGVNERRLGAACRWQGWTSKIATVKMLRNSIPTVPLAGPIPRSRSASWHGSGGCSGGYSDCCRQDARLGLVQTSKKWRTVFRRQAPSAFRHGAGNRGSGCPCWSVCRRGIE